MFSTESEAKEVTCSGCGTSINVEEQEPHRVVNDKTYCLRCQGSFTYSFNLVEALPRPNAKEPKEQQAQIKPAMNGPEISPKVHFPWGAEPPKRTRRGRDILNL